MIFIRGGGAGRFFEKKKFRTQFSRKTISRTGKVLLYAAKFVLFADEEKYPGPKIKWSLPNSVREVRAEYFATLRRCFLFGRWVNSPSCREYSDSFDFGTPWAFHFCNRLPNSIYKFELCVSLVCFNTIKNGHGRGFF